MTTRLIYQINQARHTMMKVMNKGCQEKLGISATQLTVLTAPKKEQLPNERAS